MSGALTRDASTLQGKIGRAGLADRLEAVDDAGAGHQVGIGHVRPVRDPVDAALVLGHHRVPDVGKLPVLKDHEVCARHSTLSSFVGPLKRRTDTCVGSTSNNGCLPCLAGVSRRPAGSLCCSKAAL